MLVKSGVGKVKAEKCTEFILNKFKNISGIISAGIAGAISDKLAIGDIIISSTIVDFNNEGTYCEYNPKLSINIDHDSAITGKILCSDIVINCEQQKSKIYRETKTLCVEMESVGVLRICNKYNIPFTAIKIISDFADGKAVTSIIREQYKVTENLGQFISLNI